LQDLVDTAKVLCEAEVRRGRLRCNDVGGIPRSPRQSDRLEAISRCREVDRDIVRAVEAEAVDLVRIEVNHCSYLGELGPAGRSFTSRPRRLTVRRDM